MALLTLTQHKSFAGIVTTDTTRDAALAEMIAEATDAVKRFVQNGEIEQTEYTIVMDAPAYPSLILPYTPVAVAGFELYLNWAANGDPSEFISDNLREMYRDYALDCGPASITTCESGIVRLLGSNIWGVARERPVYSLATKLVPLRGAIKVVYTAGYATVPASLRGALNLIVRKLYNMRKDGASAVSESLNGYMISRQNSATAEGIISGDPTIRNMLKTFCRSQVGSYY